MEFTDVLKEHGEDYCKKIMLQNNYSKSLVERAFVSYKNGFPSFINMLSYMFTYKKHG